MTRAARRLTLAIAVAVALAAAIGAAPALATMQGCPEASPTYCDAGGPTFTLPSWGTRPAGRIRRSTRPSSSRLSMATAATRCSRGSPMESTSISTRRPPAPRASTVALGRRAAPAAHFSDADGYDDPSLYSTIQVAQFTSRGKPGLFARQPSASLAHRAPDPRRAASRPRTGVRRRRGERRQRPPFEHSPPRPNRPHSPRPPPVSEPFLDPTTR